MMNEGNGALKEGEKEEWKAIGLRTKKHKWKISNDSLKIDENKRVKEKKASNVKRKNKIKNIGNNKKKKRKEQGKKQKGKQEEKNLKARNK